MESPCKKSFKAPMAPPYRYTPLDEAGQEIRLMTLLPGSFDDPIVVSIQKKTLTKTQIPSFEALSYAWGNASDRQEIFIRTGSMLAATGKVTFSSYGWRTLSVTSNLSQALKYIRYKEQPRVLWVDAVCVDQKNLEERGKQVMRMPDIYGSAKGVIAWLGPDSSNSVLAMKIIVHIGSRIILDFKRLTMRLACDAYNSPEHFGESLQLGEEAYRAIRDLLSRSWFERLWILQELYLGRERTHMLCGFERTSREQFCNAMAYLQYLDASDPDRIGYKLNNVVRIMTYKERGLFDNLIDLLQSTRYLQCSDPRDKVYALLNLVPNKSSAIQPDYSKSTPEVFRSIIEHSLSKIKSLRLLADCSLRERKLSMPTWVPDWSVQSQAENVIGNDKAMFQTKAYANLISSDILVTTGVHLTTVYEVTNELPQTIPRAANELAECIRKLASAIDGSGPEMTTQSRIDSLCRTLCCDLFAEKWHPPDKEFPSFPELIKHVMNSFEWLHDSFEQSSEVCSRYARYANRMMTGRTLAKMANGLLGLVPEDVRPGDVICILFGCYVPLVLRPDEGLTFKVVGECYVDGAMSGEPLLGELPDNWSRVKSRGLDAVANYCFLDCNTGRTQKDDPRISEPLAMGWRIKSHKHEAFHNWYVNDLTGEDAGIFDPRLEPAALIAQRGLDVREFRLV